MVVTLVQPRAFPALWSSLRLGPARGAVGIGCSREAFVLGLDEWGVDAEGCGERGHKVSTYLHSRPCTCAR